MVIRKAESARLSATGMKVAFYLLDGLTYELEPMALGAGQ
jgi:hypothetical protein